MCRNLQILSFFENERTKDLLATEAYKIPALFHSRRSHITIAWVLNDDKAFDTEESVPERIGEMLKVKP